MGEVSERNRRGSGESEALLRMARRARRIAGAIDSGVADLFTHHAQICERDALRPLTPTARALFDGRGFRKPACR
jgi:hypothetical protein